MLLFTWQMNATLLSCEISLPNITLRMIQTLFGSMKFKVLFILLRSGTEHIVRTRSIARGPSLRNVTDGGYKVWVSVESVFSVFEVGLQEDNKDALTPYIYLHKWMERPQMQWSN